jgi:hypothetical protein
VLSSRTARATASTIPASPTSRAGRFTSSIPT